MAAARRAGCARCPPAGLCLPACSCAWQLPARLQGPLLEKEGTQIGIVTAIAAPAALRVSFSGGRAGAGGWAGGRELAGGWLAEPAAACGWLVGLAKPVAPHESAAPPCTISAYSRYCLAQPRSDALCDAPAFCPSLPPPRRRRRARGRAADAVAQRRLAGRRRAGSVCGACRAVRGCAARPLLACPSPFLALLHACRRACILSAQLFPALLLARPAPSAGGMRA